MFKPLHLLNYLLLHTLIHTYFERQHLMADHQRHSRIKQIIASMADPHLLAALCLAYFLLVDMKKDTRYAPAFRKAAPMMLWISFLVSLKVVLLRVWPLVRLVMAVRRRRSRIGLRISLTVQAFILQVLVLFDRTNLEVPMGVQERIERGLVR